MNFFIFNQFQLWKKLDSMFFFLQWKIKLMYMAREAGCSRQTLNWLKIKKEVTNAFSPPLFFGHAIVLIN